MTETRHVQIVDAFTEDPTAGTPVGVVPDATDLTADQMQAIAAELGAPATAFVCQSDEADRRLRFFGPDAEHGRCSHATVAAFASLYDRAVVSADSYAVETGAGTFDVEIQCSGTVWVEQSTPASRPVDLDVDRVADALGLDTRALSDVGEDLPFGRVATDVAHLAVPVSYFEQLSSIDPDREAIDSLCAETDARGLYAFTFDTLERNATLHGRAFDPSRGRIEESVTGSASGAVGAYLRQHGALDKPDPLVFEQGHFVDQPGRVLVRTAASDDGDSDDESSSGPLQVGGTAVVSLDGEMSVPAPVDDDIIEA